MHMLDSHSCLTPSDPVDCSPPGSSVHGIPQARITGAGCHFLLQGNLPDPGIVPGCPHLPSFSLKVVRVHAQSLSRVRLLVTPWTAARQAPLSMGFSGQEYWSGLLFPPPGDLPDPGIKPASPALAGGFFTTATPGKQGRIYPVVCFSRRTWAQHLAPCIQLEAAEQKG